MKNKIYYSPEAMKDLNEIQDYIVTELCNPNAAFHVITKILSSVDRLQDFAKIGAPLSTVIETENNYRFLVCGDYMVFYRIAKTNVYISRILYGKRDYLSILFGEIPDEKSK